MCWWKFWEALSFFWRLLVWCFTLYPFFISFNFFVFFGFRFVWRSRFFSAYVKCPFKVWYKEWPIRFRQDFSSRRYQSTYDYCDTLSINIGEANHTKSRDKKDQSVSVRDFGSWSIHVFQRREVFTCEKLN